MKKENTSTTSPTSPTASQNNAPVILPPFFTPSVRSGNLLLNGLPGILADGNPVLVMPLTTIYGTLRTGNTLYILCNNGALHYFDRKTHQHWVSFPRQYGRRPL